MAKAQSDQQTTSLIKQIRSLAAQGKEFTFENYALKSARGYPQAPTAKWIAWTERVRLIPKALVKGSEPARIIHNGLNIATLGNEQSQFEQAKALMLSGLHAAMIVAKDRSLSTPSPLPTAPIGKRVFIVHGHDERAKNQVEILLHEFGLDPIVLHRQADLGMTITEKFEKYSDVGYAFILLTPDDIAYPAIDNSKPDNERKTERRARQNVIFEFGFFVRHLTRRRVCCLYTGGVALPSDVQMVYKEFRSNIEEVAHSIRKDLEAVGYQLKRTGE